MSEKICVIGIWHLGAVYSACLADLGYQVIGVDGDAKRIAELNKGIPPLFESGLQELITSNIKSKRLTTRMPSVSSKHYQNLALKLDASLNLSSEVLMLARSRTVNPTN